LASFELGGKVRAGSSGFVTGGFVAGVGVKVLSWPVLCHIQE
jgi:hypothetical protein